MMNTNLCVEMVHCAIKITVTQVLLIFFFYKDVFTKERMSVAMKLHDFVYIFYLLSIPV